MLLPILVHDGKRLSSGVMDELFHSLSKLAFNLKTIWLFTFSDLKTIVVPSVIFGLANASCAHGAYNLPAPASSIGHRLSSGLVTVSAVTLQVWINLLPFAMSNQRQPESIAEDRANKPWRPMPSGRLSRPSVRILMVCFYGAALLVSALLGGLRQSVALVALGFWYNNLGGADRSAIERNAINALGYLSFLTGAMEVATGSRWFAITPALGTWLLILASVLFTTVHLQDIPDQVGDRARRRNTMPLVFGDATTRLGTAAWMGMWGWACPTFWRAPAPAFALSLVLAILIAFRTMRYRCLEDDKTTFRLWNCWVGVLFLLPAMSTYWAPNPALAA